MANLFENILIIYFPINFRYKTHYYSLGGSSLNSIRILNALGEKNCLFFGAIGPDKNGQILKDILKRTSISAW